MLGHLAEQETKVLTLRQIPSDCALVELEQSQELSEGAIWLIHLIST